jgi:hypothetical protein
MGVFSPGGPLAGLSLDDILINTEDVDNVSIVTANSEVSHTIESATKIYLKSRLCGKLRVAFASGEKSTNYITVWPGGIYHSPIMKLTADTDVFIQSTKAGDIIEIVKYSFV